MSDFDRRVKRVIAEETGREPHEIGPEVDLAGDLRLDRGDLRHLLIELESEFDIVFDSDDLDEISTVGRLVRLVERRSERFVRRPRRAAR